MEKDNEEIILPPEILIEEDTLMLDEEEDEEHYDIDNIVDELIKDEIGEYIELNSVNNKLIIMDDIPTEYASPFVEGMNDLSGNQS